MKNIRHYGRCNFSFFGRLFLTQVQQRSASRLTKFSNTEATRKATTAAAATTTTQTTKSTENELDFEKSQPFAKKSFKELLRSYIILKITSYENIVKYSEKAFIAGHRMLWAPLFNSIMQSTFYGHFAAGKNVEEAKDTVTKLREAGIRTMLFIPMESPLYEIAEPEKYFEGNKEIMKRCVEGTAILEPNGFSQLKITPLADKKLFLEMNKFLQSYETDHAEPGDWDVKKITDCIESKRFQDIQIDDLSQDQNQSFRNLLQKLDEICALGRDLDVRIMLDAEQTYIQASLGYIILLLQAVYNRDKAIVFNTYQCYRKDTLDRIQADHELGERHSFQIAGKLVRGAYMFEERRLAQENSYDDPINVTYDETNQMYHDVCDFVLPVVKRGNGSFMVATHNEETVQFVTERMKEIGIDKKDPNLCFGQIYGMCDHVSYTLGMLDYQIFKSVPCGTIEDTLLYLTRRAHENRSVLQRTQLERSIIGEDIKRRFYGSTET